VHDTRTVFAINASKFFGGRWPAPLEWSDSNVSLAHVSTPA